MSHGRLGWAMQRNDARVQRQREKKIYNRDAELDEDVESARESGWVVG